MDVKTEMQAIIEGKILVNIDEEEWVDFKVGFDSIADYMVVIDGIQSKHNTLSDAMQKIADYTDSEAPFVFKD